MGMACDLVPEFPVSQIPVLLAPCPISAKTVLPRGGVDSTCLRSLCFNGHVSTRSTTQTLPVKFAFINSCSVANNTFILNDIITSHELDILFVTETGLVLVTYPHLLIYVLPSGVF